MSYSPDLYPLAELKDGLLAGQTILDIFVLQNILDVDDAEKIRGNFRTNREIENFLLKNRLVSREVINKAYSILLKLPYISLENVEIPEAAKKIIPEKLARRFGVIPFSIDERLIRLAISRPADMLTRYPLSLAEILKKKRLALELFITGENDFNSAIKQYRFDKRKFLIKKGSLPVIYLRNQRIERRYLEKLPFDFIRRYRIVVFGRNSIGDYMVACETPASPLTRKIIDFLRRENHIKIELFAASAADILHMLELYPGAASIERNQPALKPKPTVLEKQREGSVDFKNFFGGLIGKTAEPEITVDARPELSKFNELLDEQDELESKIFKEESKKPPPDRTKTDSVVKDQEPLIKASTASIESASDGAAQKQKSRKESLEEKDLSLLLGGESVQDEEALKKIVSESYVPKIVAAIIGWSLNRGASDVHIEPGQKHVRVRCRIDGVLREAVRMPLGLQAQIVSRIKIMSKLKIDETRIPQDGRFEVIFNRHEVDVRVSIMPTVNGEKVVLRVLDKEKGMLSLEDLGMQGRAFNLTIKAITKPYGIILSTGPTGSGKSTTLYAVINRVNQPGVNIITLEDPVEYEMPGVNQCQVKPEIGFSFASGLRSVLRQDPNVIMVGEIRDSETAGMATHAALTGHLVLSTLHTNDAAGALPRLINMGIEPFLITSSINLVIAQRLVRRICVKCREEMSVPAALTEQLKSELERMPKSNIKDTSRIPAVLKFYYGRGCSQCTQGFKGRVGIFEVIEMDEKIEDLAVNKKPANEIKSAALEAGMITMKQDGILKALAGLTTVDEVLQATMED